MGCKLNDADLLGVVLYDVPDCLLGHPVSPNRSYPAHSAKDLPLSDSCRREPLIQFNPYPVRYWHRSDVSSLTDKIDYRPMLFALLNVGQPELCSFAPSQTAGQQQCKQRPISLSLQPLTVWRLPQCLPLLWSEPVAEAKPELLQPFHAANACCQIGTEQTTVGCFIRQSSNCA